MTDVDITIPAAWLALAKRELARGVHELAGNADDSRIVEYLATVGLGHQHDETPWCSSFVNWCLLQAGYEGTRKGNARSWLAYGAPLKVPVLGCIVVFSREPNPTHGHVAFYAGQTLSSIEVIGGNQGNRVSRAFYPKSRWLAYRWPRRADQLAPV